MAFENPELNQLIAEETAGVREKVGKRALALYNSWKGEDSTLKLRRIAQLYFTEKLSKKLPSFVVSMLPTRVIEELIGEFFDDLTQ